MRIGIITNSDSCIPLAYTLATQQLQVYMFYSPSSDAYINQKVYAFLNQSRIQMVEEKNAKKDVYDWLIKGNYDACFILGYKQLIHLNHLNGCKTNLFNIHFGSLPEFKGPVPLFWQLKQGVQKLGLSIHRLSQRFDDGPLVWEKKVDNQEQYNYQSVSNMFNQLCIEGVFYILQRLINKVPLPILDISNKIASYQTKPGVNDVIIHWEKMTAVEIQNLIRAGNPWNKGALSVFKNQEIKLMDAELLENNEFYVEKHDAGVIVNDDKWLHIYCCDDRILKVNMVFYQDSYVPSYQCKHWGLLKGEKLGE